MQPHQDLTTRAAALARSSPQQWQEFLRALNAFKDGHKENLVNSPLADIQVNQGRAQILSILCNLLGDSVANAAKMNPKDKP